MRIEKNCKSVIKQFFEIGNVKETDICTEVIFLR